MKNLLILFLLAWVTTAMGQPTSTDQQYERDNEVLLNGGFENGIFSGWTYSGTCIRSLETSNISKGKNSLKIVCTSQSFQLIQDSTKYASQYTIASDGSRRMKIRTANTGVQFLPRFAGVSDSSVLINIPANDNFSTYEIPSRFGATSNGVEIRSNGNVTGTYYIDEVSVEPNSAISSQVTQGARIAFTPTTSNLTITPSCFYTQVGPGIQIDCSYTATANGGGGEARFGLPSGMVTPNNFTGTRMAGILIESVADAPMFTVLYEPNVSYLTFGFQTAASSGGLVKIVGSSLMNSGTRQSFSIYVPIANLSSSVNLIDSKCNADKKGCEYVLTAEVAANGDVTNENVDFIQGNCALTDTSLRTCTFVSDINLANPMRCFGAGTPEPVSIVRFSNTTSATAHQTYASGGTKYNNAFTLVCIKSGSDYESAKRYKAQAALVGFNKTEGTTSGAIDSFSFTFGTTNGTTVCSTSTCFVDQIGDHVTTVTRSTTGTYNLALKKTYTKLKCSGMAFNPTGDLWVRGPIACNNCSNVSFITPLYNDSGVADGYGTILCQGTY